LASPDSKWSCWRWGPLSRWKFWWKALANGSKRFFNFLEPILRLLNLQLYTTPAL
jgi:hypothetical protein